MNPPMQLVPVLGARGLSHYLTSERRVLALPRGSKPLMGQPSQSSLLLNSLKRRPQPLIYSQHHHLIWLWLPNLLRQSGSQVKGAGWIQCQTPPFILMIQWPVLHSRVNYLFISYFFMNIPLVIFGWSHSYFCLCTLFTLFCAWRKNEFHCSFSF